MTKISIGQIMAEILCQTENDIDQKDTEYIRFVNKWDDITPETIDVIVGNVKRYITECVGADNVED